MWMRQAASDCPAQALRFDHTKPPSARLQNLFRSSFAEQNFRQVLAARSGPHPFGKCGYPNLRDSRRQSDAAVTTAKIHGGLHARPSSRYKATPALWEVKG